MASDGGVTELMEVQREVIKWIAGGHGERMLLLVGDKRGGKTLIGTLAEVLHGERYDDAKLIFAGKTARTVQRNFVPHFKLTAAITQRSYEPHWSAGYVSLGGIECHVAGAPTSTSADAWEGFEACGAMLDEITLVPEEFFDTLDSRCSLPASRIIATCNPRAPQHWVKRRLIDGDDGEPVRVIEFDVRDNPGVPDDYVQHMMRRLPDHLRRRWFEREWAAASGVIWPEVQYVELSRIDPPARYSRVIGGVDWGSTNPTAAVWIGELADVPGKWELFDEMYILGDANLTIDVKAAKIAARGRVLAGADEEVAYYVDPSAPEMIRQLRRQEVVARSAINDVLTGLETVARVFADGTLQVVAGAVPEFERERVGYVWDEKAQERGVDAPLKVNDHTCDGLRYAVMGVLRGAGSWSGPDLRLVH